MPDMNRRSILKYAGFSVAVHAISGCVKSQRLTAKSRTPRPNILWVTLEDTSFFLGCYGDKFAHTPNIDRLAEEGARYTSAWATGSVCSPARSALITGMYVGQLGAGHHRSSVNIPDYVKGFPAYLRQAGYYCSNNSKTDYNFKNARQLTKEAWNESSGKAAWEKRAPGQPFFSVYNFIDSHQSRTSVNSYDLFKKNIQSQLSPDEIADPAKVILPPFYNDTPDMRRAFARMYDCLTAVDKQVGKLLKKLDDQGLADDTIVFFFGDHGQGMPRFKSTPLGLGYKVPLIIRVPEKFERLANLKSGETYDSIVSFVDFGPTVLSLCGVDVPKHMAGVPFLGPQKGKPKKFFYGSLDYSGETEGLSRTVSDGRYLYVHNYMPHLSYVQPFLYFDHAEIVTFMKQYKKAGTLTESAAEYMADKRPPEVLYDLEKDPWEINNLVDDPKYRKILNRLRKWNREKILSLRDAHFMHPWEMKTRAPDQTVCQIRYDPALYPLKKILSTAELTGMGESVLKKQLSLLNDSEPLVRYWAVIGLASQNRQSGIVQQALLNLLDDQVPYVRYEAAMLCYKHSKNSKAKEVLLTGLNEEHPWLVYHAIRKIQLLGNDAADFVEAIKELKQRFQKIRYRGRFHGIQSCVTGIENHLAGRYAEPNDDF
jgi:arylsulfatase A-like enzyme